MQSNRQATRFRPPAGLLFALVLLVGLLPACGLTSGNPGGPSDSDAARATATLDVPLSATPEPTLPPTVQPPRTSPSPTAGQAAAQPTPVSTPAAGAAGIGDPYFPTMGNGGYDALHYDLTLVVKPAIQEIEAISLMRARATEALRSFYLDFEQLTIEELLVDGEPAAHEHQGDQLVVTPAQALPAGAQFSVQVSYRGRPLPSSEPAGPAGWFWTAGAATVAAEPFGAQTWFPANDHPLDKATYRLQVTVPRPLVVASNGLLVETIEEDDALTYVWEARDPMASYLLTISIDEYEIHEAENADGLPLISFSPPGEGAEMQAATAATGEMIDYFEQLFGPYPFETYGAIAVQGRLPGFAALETQTRSLFFGVPLNDDLLVHELAHQWFGDSVSLESWQDLWLKEGMATYAELLWLERSEGRAAVDARVAMHHDEMVRGARAGFYAPPGRPSPDALYGFPVYEGGAVVLHALRSTVGDVAFFQTLQTYTERYAYGNASTADLQAVAEEVSGQDLGDFFDAWVYGSPPPELPVPLAPEERAGLLRPRTSVHWRPQPGARDVSDPAAP